MASSARLANNENVFHFDSQFPQFLNATAVVTAPQKCSSELLKLTAQMCRTGRGFSRSEPFPLRFIPICGLKWQTSSLAAFEWA